jgi:DNA-binding beta-propeller fold protein YncE
VAVDPSNGNIAVSDATAGKVLVFTSAGAFVNSMTAANAYAVAIDAANGGNIVVTELFNNLARVYTPAGVLVRTIQGSGANAIDSPRAVAVDPSNSNVLIADYFNGRIQIFASDGTFLRSLHPPTGSAVGDDAIAPFGVAVDPVNGNIVVSSEQPRRAIYVYNAGGAFVARILPPTGAGGLDTALSAPSHVAIDPVNGRNIVLADRVLNRMQVYANTFGTDRAVPAPIDTLDARATILLSIACLLLGAVALRRRG